MRMKLKKITAVALIAALLAANISVTGFADTGAAAGTPDGHPVASPSNASKKVKNESSYRVASPSDADRESGNKDGSDAAEIISADGKIVFPQGLDAEMISKFKALLESDKNKTVLADVAKTIAEQHGNEIAQLFDGGDVDKIEVFVEVKLEQVEMEDGGRYVQCVLYSVVPKAHGFKDDSPVSTKDLDCSYQMGERHEITLAIPADYIDPGIGAEGVYVTRGELYYWLSYYAYSSQRVPVSDDFGGFGEALIVPSQYEIFEHKYYQDEEGNDRWVGVKSLPVGESVRVSFNGYPFDGFEIGPTVSGYLDCKMGPDGDSMIITGKKSTEGASAEFYLVRELNGGLESKHPFWVEVVAAPYSGGSSSSSDEDDSYSAPPSTPESFGSWEAGEKGWWYRYKDGTYPSNGWNLLEWQGKTSWYYFDAGGYMTSGWLTDADGNRYFLHDKPDGTQGYMYTGWHEIDGKWYYFSEAEGGPLGSLLVNTTTPDGYQVGADGAWIQ